MTIINVYDTGSDSSHELASPVVKRKQGKKKSIMNLSKSIISTSTKLILTDLFALAVHTYSNKPVKRMP